MGKSDTTEGIAGTWWPTAAALALLGAVAAVVIGAAVRQAGQFGYALDDAYIDMAIGKNLAEHRVWGVTAYEFSSAASSLLWPLLLAGFYWLAGPSEFSAIALTLLGGAATLVVSGAVLRRFGVRGRREFLALALIVVLAPIVPVAMTGLEHTAHAAATVALSYFGAVVLSRRDRAGSLSRAAALCVISALTVMLRYEGLFLTAGIVGFLLLQRRVTLAVVLVAAAWTPVVLYGFYSTSHEAMWLPNPVAIKGNTGSMHSLSEAAHELFAKWLNVRNVAKASHIIMLAVLAAALYLRRWRQERENPTAPGFMALTFAVATGLHLLLAGLGYFFRYEQYLDVLGIVVVAVNLPIGQGDTAIANARGWIWRLAIPALAALTLIPLGVRGAMAHWQVPGASADIANLDGQLARFVKQYYNPTCVVINDIGVVAYRTDAHILDIWGLANTDTARLYLEGQLTSAAIGRLAQKRGASVAAVYDHLLGADRPPPGWRKVAVWKVHNRARDIYDLNFYGTGEVEAVALREHMREFAGSLPPDVEVHEEPLP